MAFTLAGKLKGKTLFISGASRGIGKAIALRAARDGANIIVAAKTSTPHPKLPGTIFTAAKEIEAAGGRCLPVVVDIRDENQTLSAVAEGVKKFGGIDICVNNASAISLTRTAETTSKKFDLMMGINTRGTFFTTQACLPHLLKSDNAHVLNISPPLNLNPRWFRDHTAYTIAKYGMSMCVLGMSEEFKPSGIAVNALWPRTAIYTAAMDMLAGKEVEKSCRRPEIMADAAYYILSQPSRSFTGKFLIDDEVLKEAGVTDFDPYAYVPGAELMPDFFLDEDTPLSTSQAKTSQSPPSPSPSSSASSSSSSSSSSAATDSQMAQLFSKIKASIKPEMIQEVKGVVQVELNDIADNHWFIDLKNPNGDAGRGKKDDAKVTFKCSSVDFHKIVQGELSPTKAFLTGKVKIEGSLGRAQKLIGFLPQLR